MPARLVTYNSQNYAGTLGPGLAASEYTVCWPVHGIFSVISQLFQLFPFPNYSSLISLKFPTNFSVISHFLLYFPVIPPANISHFSLISHLFLNFSFYFSLSSWLFLTCVFVYLSHLLPDMLWLWGVWNQTFGAIMEEDRYKVIVSSFWVTLFYPC